MRGTFSFLFVISLLAFSLMTALGSEFGSLGVALAMTIPAATLYSDPNLLVGSIAEHHPAEYIRTKIAESSLPFGRAVVQGTIFQQGKIISSAGDIFLGVSKRSTDASDLDNDSYADGDPLAIAETAVIMVYAEEAINEGDPVRVRHTAGTGTVAGSFCTTAEAGHTAVLDNAEFVGSCEGPGPVALYLKGPDYGLSADA